MKYILQCPRCKDVILWERKSDDDGPGYCQDCFAWAPWNVLKEEPATCPICGKHHNKRFICEDDHPEDWSIFWET